MAKILVLDDDSIFRKTLCRALLARGHEATPAEDGAKAVDLASTRRFDVAIIDMMMPGMNGTQALVAIKEAQPSVACIVLTGYGSIADAVKSIRLGGYHYLTKPCDIQEIEDLIAAIKPDSEPAAGEERYQGIIGVSPGIKDVVRFIKRVKDSNLPVLIMGESGTGKELVAQALHFDSRRKDAPFIAMNCACLKPGLLENELFGHVKGAFTGAADQKEGLVKAADNGTLFIDEIGDLDLSVQAALLRFIETGTYRPLGSSKEIHVTTRIITAINKDIEEEVASKRFRLDLYYRLNVCRVHIPPLRRRPEDIPALANYFLRNISVAEGRNYAFTPETMELLVRHDWPGNVRELLHLVQRAAVLSPEDVITAAQVMKSIGRRHAPSTAQAQSLEEMERGCILSVLSANGWNISRSAKALNIDRRTLQRKMTKYAIRRLAR
ncbi:MAG TPA: hypothetical protein DDW94_12330 [Deltaproteobacteria bacterium]|nr:MAG: hypothetical protein A2Z79_08475 [Deltaproteobacteria bacterium GWA2_55_82]OGQ63154.1 MAG: hypothetical protein A3I81_10105 [Deltaproteobacteria bacterium RIFCSPLOWO2_02_FULL_55_12]OIJ73619.1 MAG: hypothetical protein A2V21_304670 [Deltaproteobacteria bacterium GWC2_55_46]HBG47756.1 hypothetical protein [Deltaproteobacteria bacterium]HCY12022.1 hypothetical protein [Deltaproteobacteria bacterium]